MRNFVPVCAVLVERGILQLGQKNSDNQLTWRLPDATAFHCMASHCIGGIEAPPPPLALSTTPSSATQSYRERWDLDLQWTIQGKPGSSFHIITAGRCRVTIHDPNAPGQQREVTKLHQDDFFGEGTAMRCAYASKTPSRVLRDAKSNS